MASGPAGAVLAGGVLIQARAFGPGSVARVEEVGSAWRVRCHGPGIFGSVAGQNKKVDDRSTGVMLISMRRDSSNIRQRILDAGEAIIAGKGFSAVGLAEILGASKVPKGSFYYYFESKEQFGEALLESYFADYLVRLEGLLGATTSRAGDRLMAYWQRWQEVQSLDLDARQCLVVKLSAEVSDLSETMRRVLQKGTDAVLARIEACVQDGIQDGSLAPLLDPNATAHALYQLWLGASLLAKVSRDASPFERAMGTTRTWLGVDTAKPQ